jgi:acyl carrier protein
MSAKDVPEWDSFNHINIIVAAEQRFGVKFRTAEIEALRTVGEFADLIARKRETP